MTPAARPWWRPDAGGILVGIVAIALSLTPSLLPRPALLQGVLSGASFAIGYALGLALTWAVLAVVRRRPSPRAMRIARLILATVAVIGVVVVAVLAVGWQNEVRALVEVEPIDGVAGQAFLGGLVGTGILLLLLGRAVAAMRRDFAARMPRSLPRAAAAVFSWLATAAVVVTTLAVLVGGGLVAVDRIWWDMNGAPDDGTERTLMATQSGSPQSLVDWNDLGRHGADFVTSGPTAEEITDVTGLPAIEPIRVYVGMASAPTIDERASLAVDELERTGAFDRAVLVVAAATGSGWIEPQTVDSIEYLMGGDTAIVGIQFAHTPSWVSSLTDPDLPDEAFSALFAAVEQRWAQLPPEARPRLVVNGLSLGAQAIQNTFGSLESIRDRTDGALLLGSPGTVALWRSLQDARDPGSPAWQPVLDDGIAVRWASLPGDLDVLPGPWDQPRVVFLQHATDPVTWLDGALFWSSPEWLEPEQRGPDVSDRMRWIPVITGLQVTIDMLMGQSVPARHGHNFGDVMTSAWAGVLGPELLAVRGITAETVEAIEAEIALLAPIPPFLE